MNVIHSRSRVNPRSRRSPTVPFTRPAQAPNPLWTRHRYKSFNRKSRTKESNPFPKSLQRNTCDYASEGGPDQTVPPIACRASCDKAVRPVGATEERVFATNAQRHAVRPTDGKVPRMARRIHGWQGESTDIPQPARVEPLTCLLVVKTGRLQTAHSTKKQAQFHSITRPP
jgi:hypothetical protein